MARRQITAAVLLLSGGLVLAGCGEAGVAGALRDSGVGGTPDEFMVLPTRPLEMPADVAALPPPTPGAANRVDQQPHAEAIAGLTGRQGPAGTADGSALVARAGGADPQIRGRLAAEDADWRANNRGLLFERWTARDPEALVYRDMKLDSPAAFEAARARGLRVPAPPPSVLGEP